MPFGSEAIEPGLALAMSGGGFRAVLFHVGSILRLNDSGLLPKLKRISSVSGGSIAAGILAVRWDQLKVNPTGKVENLEEEFVQPLRAFCSRNLDAWSVIGGALNPFKTAGDEVIDAYRDHLGLGVGLKTLSDAGPRFVFNATNFATGVSFRFSKPYCGDYRIGLIKNHNFDVALAVGCSSAFPPVLSPIEIDVDPASFERTAGADLYDQIGFRKKLQLGDGGIYDNLGLETVWGRYGTVLVSDAGKPFEVSINGPELWSKQLMRVMDIGLNQALSLRKRMLMHQFQSKAGEGAFWAIDTEIADYSAPNPLPVTAAKIKELSSIRTRLNKFNEQEQCELVNWGYAVTDAALRTHQPTVAGPYVPNAFPYPRFSLSP